MDEQRYDIYRIFFPATRGHTFCVIRTGLTLEEAKAHVANPESSSRTATSVRAKLYTKIHRAEWSDYWVKHQ